jgi:sigma-54-dependent transcriptional regulator
LHRQLHPSAGEAIMLDQFHDPLTAVAELIKITTSLSTEKNLNQLLHMIVTSARKLTHADGGRVYILDRTKRYLYAEVCQNDTTSESMKSLPPIPLFREDGRRNIANVCAYCAFAGKLVNIPDVYKYSGFDFNDTYSYDQFFRYRTTSVLAVPLRNYEGITIGILQLVNCLDPVIEKTIPFPTTLESLVTAFASQAAVAIDNVQLISQNRHLIELLNHTNEALEEENRQLREQLEGKHRFADIIGNSPPMQKVFSLMSKVLDSDATVLLHGETGTGKELIASAIHYNSQRREGIFVAQNCAALPEHLLESELFGYRRGAFTGATTDKKGLIEIAHKGTLFLDEISDMPLGMQAKLLRVLQDREVRPLGSVTSSKVNIRVIAATNADLQAKVSAGEFREDLYYRLCVFPIHIPPLRERQEDVPLLLYHFLKIYAQQYHKHISGFSPRALDLLLQYTYPGNIRELKNLVERAVLLCEHGGSIVPDHLPVQMIQQEPEINWQAHREVASASSLPAMVKQFEASLIEQKLKEYQWNQTRTAQALSVSRRTLIAKMQRYNIRRNSAFPESN